MNILKIIIIKKLYARNISLLFGDKIIMANKSLNKSHFINFSEKFISLNRFQLIKVMIISLICLLIINIYIFLNRFNKNQKCLSSHLMEKIKY
jgi:hypothetical protein